LNRALEVGLDGVAICDHDSVEGGLRGVEVARELGLSLWVVPGVEVSTLEGHVLVLGVEDDIPRGLSVEETVSIARGLGGVCVASHPFKSNGVGGAAVLCDGVEAFNGRCIFGENEAAQGFAVEHGLAVTGGSDSHYLETIGCAYTVVDGDPLRSIRAGESRWGGSLSPLRYVLVHALEVVARRTLGF